MRSIDPDFFAAVPYREISLTIRIQRGSDFRNFSTASRSSQATSRRSVRRRITREVGRQAFRVDIPPEVTAAGHAGGRGSRSRAS